MTGGSGAIYVLTLFVVPALVGLLLLMEWLETHIARAMVADDIAVLLRAEVPVDDLELSIARASEPILDGIRGAGNRWPTSKPAQSSVDSRSTASA
jgi:hypothetical protein